jgi:formate dehydrogenase iron-sulfur subunit
MSAPLAILTDTTRCTGCERCVEACRQTWDLGPDRPRRWKVNINDLSSTRLTTILRKSGDHNVRQQCRHCLEPACVSACLVGAMTKTPEGPVIYDPKRCMGCRYCMVACPYGIPRYAWEDTAPKVRKCTMCYERLKQGGIPACVEACPEKATIFGTREEMLRVAHERLRQEPGRYQNRVYGETEIGGTSVLYLSDIPLDFLAFKPDLGDTPLPERTWAALTKVPPLVGLVGGLMAGTWWVIGRRMLLAEQQAAEAQATAPEPPAPADNAENSETES